MALPSSFWLPLAGLLIVAPQPASAASFWAYTGASVGFGTSPKSCQDLEATSATCDTTNTAKDPNTGETISGEVHVRADLASGDLSVSAESASSGHTAEAGGEAQIGDTFIFGGAISPTSIGTLHMSGTMSGSPTGDNSGLNPDSFTSASLQIFDDNGLITGGGACSRPSASFICDPLNNQTKVSVVGNSFFISSTFNLFLHKQTLVEFVLYASTYLTTSADISDPITIDLPQGVTFTSASGVFLTGAGSVPETSTWAMLLAGFASLGVLACRARRRAALLG